MTIQAHPDHPVWMPSIPKQDPESPWMQEVERLNRGLAGRGPVDF